MDLRTEVNETEKWTVGRIAKSLFVTEQQRKQSKLLDRNKVSIDQLLEKRLNISTKKPEYRTWNKKTGSQCCF